MTTAVEAATAPSVLNEWSDVKKLGEEAPNPFDFDTMTRASSSDGRDSPAAITPPASLVSLPGVVNSNVRVSPHLIFHTTALYMRHSTATRTVAGYSTF